MLRAAATAFIAIVLGAASLTGQDSAPLQTPADVLSICHDYAQANPATCSDLRCLWFGNIPAKDRPEMIAVLNSTLNSLSREQLITPGTLISDTIMEVHLGNYGITAEAWDELATQGSGPVRVAAKRSLPEPYFHITSRVTTQTFEEKLVDVPAYRAADGKTYTQKWEKVPGKKQTSEQLVHLPGLSQNKLTALALATGTDYPIMRADWFVANALLPPAYYRLMGIKTLADYNTLIRYRPADDDLAIRAHMLFSSLVTENNRFAIRVPTVFGSFWLTGDFFSSIGDQDMLSNVFTRKADAHEGIGTKPNGMHAFVLFNGQDKLLDFADPNIAIDRDTSWHNKLVWAGLSCLTCHHGYQPFKDDIRKLADRSKNIFALVRQGPDTKQFLNLFGRNINDLLVADQASYAKAMLACNGLTPEANSAALLRIFLRHVQEPVTMDMAVMETGFPREKIIAILKAAQGLDHSLVQLLADIPVRRDQWEHSGYGQLMTLLTATK